MGERRRGKENKGEQDISGGLQENKTVPGETDRHSDHDKPTNRLTKIKSLQLNHECVL